MKKYTFLFLLFIAAIAKGQITLDFQTNRSLNPILLNNDTAKYLTGDFDTSFIIENLDTSLYKHIRFPSGTPSWPNVYQVSDMMFETDPATVEYLLYLPVDSLGFIVGYNVRIIDQNDQILLDEDFNSQVYFKVFNTSQGTKLILSEQGGAIQTTVHVKTYSLPGTFPGNIPGKGGPKSITQDFEMFKNVIPFNPDLTQTLYYCLESDSVLSIYQLDGSLLKTIHLPIPPAGGYVSKINYISTELFDSDPSTFEFAVAYNNPDNTPNSAKILGENGDVLLELPEFGDFIVTPGEQGTQLLMEKTSLPLITNVYSIPGAWNFENAGIFPAVPSSGINFLFTMPTILKPVVLNGNSIKLQDMVQNFEYDSIHLYSGDGTIYRKFLVPHSDSANFLGSDAITTNLFDNDSSTIEYIAYYSRPYFNHCYTTSILRENGDILLDERYTLNYSYHPIFRTEEGSKIMFWIYSENYFEGTKVYDLPGDYPTGITRKNTVSDYGLTLYPNPNQGSFTIESISEINQIQVLTIQGKVIHTEPVNSKKIHFKDLDLVPGLYLIKSISGKNVSIEKMVVK